MTTGIVSLCSVPITRTGTMICDLVTSPMSMIGSEMKFADARTVFTANANSGQWKRETMGLCRPCWCQLCI